MNRSYLIICVVVVSIFLNFAVERPMKIIFLEGVLKTSFLVMDIPNPLLDPNGWIEGVRQTQHIFACTNGSENSRDYHIELKDGQKNWIRVIFPENSRNDNKTRAGYPIFIWFHGGGYVLGNYSYEDHWIFPLSNRLNYIVISVDYRLAPEHKFPSAVEDAYQSFLWISENAHLLGGDKEKIFVGGESSGGSISMVISHLLHENDIHRPKIKGIYLNCPGILLLQSESFQLYRQGYILEESWIKVFSVSYVNQLEEWFSPLASPLNLKNFSGLPPALVHISNLDVVRDGSLYLVERLERENFGKVTWRVFDKIPHAGISSFRWLFKKESDEALDHIHEWTTRLLA